MPYEYEGMFIDGDNCIMYENNLNNLTDKIDYYLKHDEERNRIINNAYLFAKNKYTWKCMALKLINEIKILKK